jgi:hypothetical protein
MVAKIGQWYIWPLEMILSLNDANSILKALHNDEYISYTMSVLKLCVLGG